MQLTLGVFAFAAKRSMHQTNQSGPVKDRPGLGHLEIVHGRIVFYRFWHAILFSNIELCRRHANSSTEPAQSVRAAGCCSRYLKELVRPMMLNETDFWDCLLSVWLFWSAAF